MSKPTTAFATIRRARTLRERRPDAPSSVCHVALVMATYAKGYTGVSIRPGQQHIMDETGLSRSTAQRAIGWLVKNGEIRRDRRGHSGSASCFTYLGVTELRLTAAQKGLTGESPTTNQPRNEAASTTVLQDDQVGQPQMKQSPCDAPDCQEPCVSGAALCDEHLEMLHRGEASWIQSPVRTMERPI